MNAKRELFGKAVFLRHGESNYTGQLPDLTEQGKQTIQAAAELLWKLRMEHKGPAQIVSSPAPRAMGTSWIIAERLCLETSFVRPNHFLRPVDQHDRRKAEAIYREIHMEKGGHRGLCISYGQDPRFEDERIFEPRSHVNFRFYQYLGMMARDLQAQERPFFVVNVSHLEVLYHFAEKCFALNYENGDSPFMHGELLVISFFKTGKEVEMDITFRAATKTVNLSQCLQQAAA